MFLVLLDGVLDHFSWPHLIYLFVYVYPLAFAFYYSAENKQPGKKSRVKIYKITPTTVKERGDIEIKEYVVTQKPQTQKKLKITVYLLLTPWSWIILWLIVYEDLT